MEYNTRN